MNPHGATMFIPETGRSAWMPLVCLAGVAMFGAIAGGASADTPGYGISVKPEFGQQLSDVARTEIVVFSGSPTTEHFSCDATVSQVKNEIVVDVTVVPGASGPVGSCTSFVSVPVGPLAAGAYSVTTRVHSQSGTELADLSLSVAIAARGPKCNVDPFVNTIAVTPILPRSEFLTRFESDAAYRALFGDVGVLLMPGFGYVFLAFPPLQDPVRELAHLQQTGEFNSEIPNDPLCIGEGTPEIVGTVVEYHNTILDHYFMTPDAGEQAAIEGGNVGPGWARTGASFKAVVTPSCPGATEGGFHPVYRFAGISNIGPDSHFFTVSQDECAVVRDRTEWHWQFEGAPFWATEPSHGTCPANTKSLYRAYNNGMGGTANHRYSTDAAIIASMVAKGWVSEGVAMCVLP
jgi:hypothetical protein